MSAACREELITRNVVTLVEAPKVDPYEGKLWTLDKCSRSSSPARRDPLYAAFMLAIGLGLRRGELVGLRWQDIDFDGRTLQVRKQRQRARGENYKADTKTAARGRSPCPFCVSLRFGGSA
ncbi:Site-specific integrase OS=Streptomyces antimycoticus OX=68175 GN=SSPO_048200 PE=4 SV=1 [Streptomyces antimycoticus]